MSRGRCPCSPRGCAPLSSAFAGKPPYSVGIVLCPAEVRDAELPLDEEPPPEIMLPMVPEYVLPTLPSPPDEVPCPPILCPPPPPPVPPGMTKPVGSMDPLMPDAPEPPGLGSTPDLPDALEGPLLGMELPPLLPLSLLLLLPLDEDPLEEPLE